MSPHRPPVLAQALLRLLLPRAVFDSFAGDLEERFHRVAQSDPAAARRGYWKDVLSPTVLRVRKEVRGMALPPGAPPDSGPGEGLVKALLTDLRFALRVLAKAPLFTAIAVLSLALGIGPNTAIFSLVNSVLFQDWGVDDPDTLIDVYGLNSDGRHYFSGYRTFEIVSEGATDVLESVTAHSVFAARIEPAAGGDAEFVLGEMVVGNYFDVMGVPAVRGRTFLPEEDVTPGTHQVVVLSERYWRNSFGADPSLVGGEVRMNGRPYTVVGIAPATFRGRIAPGVGTDFWVPIRTYPHLNPSKMTSGDLTISARVRSGVDPQTALVAIETVGQRYDEELKRQNPDRRSTFALAPVVLGDVMLHPDMDGFLSAAAVLLLVAVGLVLLVACVNLAGFLLSRALDRRKEMAVRIAMGAGRGAIVRQLLVESLVLASMGGALGLALGQLALRAIVSVDVPLPFPISLDVALDGRLLAFTALTVVVAAVIFGLTPALEAARAPVAGTLRDEGGASGGRGKVGARRILVAAQMTLSTMLLFGAALFVRSLQAATETDLGFATREAAVLTVESEANEYSDEQRLAFVEELERRVEALPGIDAFGVTSRMPVALMMNVYVFDIPGVEPLPNENRHRLEYAAITPDYLDAMGIEVVDGRGFVDSDRADGAPVALLSRAAASQYWPGESAVGKTLLPGGDAEPITVVGVVDNVKIWSLTEAPKPYLYLPYLQGHANAMFYLVATGSTRPSELADQIRTEARAIDPEIFLSEVGTMDDHLQYIYFLPRLAALMLTVIGALALVLACVGLYGMISYSVSRRTREMGIRLALGADRQGVVKMVVRGGLALVIVGGGLGLAASLVLGRLVSGFLYGAGALDPLAVAAAPVVLMLVATLAAYVPARRAARVDPMQALRTE